MSKTSQAPKLAIYCEDSAKGPFPDKTNPLTFHFSKPNVMHLGIYSIGIIPYPVSNNLIFGPRPNYPYIFSGLTAKLLNNLAFAE